jgi:prolyl-tRNA editing enzyme YbaK/EbsC (Cys-tRNA(Pro) deacylase)
LSEGLKAFLASRGVWHRFIEFEEPVKTVEQAARKVPVEKIAKSILLVDHEGKPLLAILPARSRISFRKVKALMNLKDVRLASPGEVEQHTGYPAGGVPPIAGVERKVLDTRLLGNETVIGGGGDIYKLMEIRVRDLLALANPIIGDISE